MRLIATSALLTIAFLAIPASTSASTPEAWAQLDQRVVRACIAMSGLSRPQVLARKISFSDTIGIEVRMLRGVERGIMQRKLCAYNRRTGRTEVQDAAGWFGTTVKP